MSASVLPRTAGGGPQHREGADPDAVLRLARSLAREATTPFGACLDLLWRAAEHDVSVVSQAWLEAVEDTYQAPSAANLAAERLLEQTLGRNGGCTPTTC